MRWVEKKLGIWELCRWRWLEIDGTTPRNAGHFTATVVLFGPRGWRGGVSVALGRNWGLDWFADNDRRERHWGQVWYYHGKKCACYQCEQDRAWKRCVDSPEWALLMAVAENERRDKWRSN